MELELYLPGMRPAVATERRQAGTKGETSGMRASRVSSMASMSRAAADRVKQQVRLFPMRLPLD